MLIGCFFKQIDTARPVGFPPRAAVGDAVSQKCGISEMRCLGNDALSEQLEGCLLVGSRTGPMAWSMPIPCSRRSSASRPGTCSPRGPGSRKEDGLLDRVVVPPGPVTVPAQHVELVPEVRSVEEVAGVAVLRDEPQCLPLAGPADQDRRMGRRTVAGS